MTTLRIGTRTSELAMYQAELVRDAVRASDPDIVVELVPMVSDGDRDARELRDIGERGIFAAHLERELEAGTIDAAVHSSKDLQLEPHASLVLAAWLPREDVRDALVGFDGASVLDLREGAVVSTGSARRTSALRTINGSFVPSPIRGNVRTRIARSAERGDDACLLAMAGLVRLGIPDERTDIVPIPVDVLVPEAGQGAVVVQTRGYECDRTGFAWSRLDHVPTRRTVTLEREFARLLGGGCTRPIGVHVQLDATRIFAFGSSEVDAPGTTVEFDVLGLDLAPLLSVSSPADIDDAVHWVGQRLAPQLAELLGMEARA